MTSVSFVRTITELQVSLLTTKNIIYCKNTRISSKICAFFLEQGLIHKYMLISTKYEIWPKCHKNLRVIKNVQLISTPGWNKYYSLYKIKTLLWKTKNHLYLISTTKHGFISHRQAIKFNTGGEVLAKIETI